MVQQELTAGKTVPQKYDKLGYRTPTLLVKPRHLFGLLAGKPGSGKTSLLASCDSCFIINTDLSSVPVDEADYNATFWPVVGQDGQPLGPGGVPVDLTWETVLQKRAQIFEMIAAGEPTPDMIAVDSIAGAIQLIKDYIVKKNGKKAWRDLDGRRAWDELNDEVVDFATSFRRRGKGFFYTCHLVDSKVPIGEDLMRVMPEVTVSPSTWRRLVWQLELVAVVGSEWQSRSREIEQEAPGGRKRTKTVTERSKVHLITTNREELAGITKGRVQLNDVVLPKHGAWDAFEAAYEEQATEEIPW